MLQLEEAAVSLLEVVPQSFFQVRTLAAATHRVLGTQTGRWLLAVFQILVSSDPEAMNVPPGRDRKERATRAAAARKPPRANSAGLSFSPFCFGPVPPKAEARAVRGPRAPPGGERREHPPGASLNPAGRCRFSRRLKQLRTVRDHLGAALTRRVAHGEGAGGPRRRASKPAAERFCRVFRLPVTAALSRPARTEAGQGLGRPPRPQAPGNRISGSASYYPNDLWQNHRNSWPSAKRG